MQPGFVNRSVGQHKTIGVMWKSVLMMMILIIPFIMLQDVTSAQNGQNGDDDYVKVGGALRLNLLLTEYGNGVPGEDDNAFTIDTWRINVNAARSGVRLHFEYRFYPTFSTHFIKSGWLGYDFSDELEFRLGVQQVPFGGLEYASHSWWFQTPYYVGLEDDYDTGFGFFYTKKNWSVAAAYFMEAQPNGAAAFGAPATARYSYDIVPGGNQTNVETNQFNLRFARTLVYESGSAEAGISLQRGGIYNQVSGDMGHTTAAALHVDADIRRLNIKAQAAWYRHNARDDEGNRVDVVKMAAYGVDAYDVAAEAVIYQVGVSYSLPVDIGPVSDITFYENYAYTKKAESGFYDTQQNVLGFLVTAGMVYTYFDIASGKNHPWLTSDFGQGLGRGRENPRWNTRFNINIGFYF